jgi:4-hydroxybenzoate polyprenyltransferase
MSQTEHMQETETDGRVADAVDRNWVDRFAPPAARPYLRLSRADRPAGTWLLLIPCWWSLALAVAANPGTANLRDVWIAVGCAIGAFLMRGAGCTWNDLADQEFDAKVARTRSRPLPSGQVTRKQALIWMVAQALLAFCILLTFNLPAILLGIASLALVAIYPYAKRFTWWPQIFLGLAFNWGALLAWTARTGEFGWPPLLLYIAGIGWTLFYDTIYAHQDKEDDALIGVKSTARLFAEETDRLLLISLLIALIGMTFAVIQALIDTNPLILIAGLMGPWAFGWHLNWQMRRLDIDDPARCLMLFRSNRDAGLAPALFFCLAIGVGFIA